MTYINGLPTHVLLVHFIVVLAPITAILVAVCSVWESARTRLVWPTLGAAVFVMVLTPLTTEAGEHFKATFPQSPPAVEEHAELGDTMLYVSAAILIAAIAVTLVHLRPMASPAKWGIAALAVVIGVFACVQTFRIGESGSRAVWGDSRVQSMPVEPG